MTIDAVRGALEAAENAGDAAAVTDLLTVDVVAMVPSAPVLEGREACGAFVRETLADLLAIFDRRVAYVSAETAVIGDHGYDRGVFTMVCVARDGGGRHEATGKYFWLLRREEAGWRIARLIHAVDEPGEGAPETIETPRLRLARPRPDDAQDIFDRYASDPEVTRYLAWPTHRTVADTQAFLAFSDEQWASHPVGPYLVRSREDGRLVGSTGLQIEGEGRATTGYVLARDAWGHGYATEILQAMLSLAAELGLSELSASAHADHVASRRVLEKCDFVLDEAGPRPVAFPNLPERSSMSAVRYVRRP